jgi:imidazolonepropionase-like amidohydrolase
VNIAMGTDSGVTPHGQNLRELEQMVGCGMSPSGAIVASTRTAAQLMGIADDRGTLEPGKRADLLAVGGSPYDFAGMRDRIQWVMQAGRVVVDNAA